MQKLGESPKGCSLTSVGWDGEENIKVPQTRENSNPRKTQTSLKGENLFDYEHVFLKKKIKMCGRNNYVPYIISLKAEI